MIAPNLGKSLIIEVDGRKFQRIPVKTHVITHEDNIADVLIKYAKDLMEDGDILFISEKAVSCMQSRAVKMSDIKPRRLAVFLSRHVHKTPHGIGLGIPETMEMALQEVGVPRILFAAFISVIGKVFRRRGWFYNVAGEKARSIDGPTPNTLPPYNEYVVLGPINPDQTSKTGSEALGHPVMIVDINDLGGNVLGTSDSSMNRDFFVQVLKDNPLGQSSEQTPIGIIREIMDIKLKPENRP